MKVVQYAKCLPPNNKNVEKGEILNKIHTGVKSVGDTAIMHNGNDVVDCDVACSVGWVHDSGKNTPHLQLRKRILDYQTQTKSRTLLVDSNLFLYKNTDNPLHYLRYSFDGIFPNTGEYCDKDIDPMRWKKISHNLGLRLNDYRSNGSHILICLQRNGGWSMGGLDVMTWLNRTINELRKFTDREILIRPHPGDKGAKKYLSPKELIRLINGPKNIRISRPDSTLIKDLKNCWAVVNHNSSPAVGAAIEGYPVFMTDPIRSQAKEIAQTNFARIESPDFPDREQWVQRISMFHWNFKEVESGEMWHHMRKFV